jgi:putative transposase
VLSLSKFGRLGLRVHRPLQGTPKTVALRRDADAWYAALSCTEGLTEPLPATGEEPGINVGLLVLLITAGGQVLENPRHYARMRRSRSKPGRAASWCGPVTWPSASAMRAGRGSAPAARPRQPAPGVG